MERKKNAPYKWTITKDLVSDPEETCVGITGPHNANLDNIDLPDRFRMYDDDQERCYEGVCNCLSSKHKQVDGFEPLDDFGEPNAGCTIIAYFQKEPPRFPASVIEKTKAGFWVML